MHERWVTLIAVLVVSCCGALVVLNTKHANQRAILREEEHSKAVQAYESQIQYLKSQLKAAEYEVDYWRKKACP